jgi:pSer/pThr/pTyr-binding forkhead associated (FHA) protein
MNNKDVLEGGWVLQGVDGQGRDVSIRLTDREIVGADFGLTLGRHSQLADRVMEDPSISRRHLRINLREGRLLLEDLNSLNGTLLDGEDLAPFEPTPGADGQTLRLGRVELKISRVAD